MPPDLILQVEAWAKANRASRSEALRRLVEIGLSKSNPLQKPQVHSTAKQGAARAAEMAAKGIASAPPKPIVKPGRRTRAKELAKDAIDQAFETPLSAGIELERRSFLLARASVDADEGLSAFVEKRKPDFRGR